MNHDPLCLAADGEPCHEHGTPACPCDCRCELIQRVRLHLLNDKYHDDQIQWEQAYKSGYEDAIKDKIVFIPYKNGYGYYLKYIDAKGHPKYLGKIRADSLQTALWFYRLEGIDLEIMEDNMNDAIDDYFEQKFQDL